MKERDKCIALAKEFLEVSFIPFFSNAKLTAVFNTSVLHYTVMPLLVVPLTAMTAVSAYEFGKNPSFHNAINTVFSFASTGSMTAAVSGATAASAIGTTFAATPYLFIAGLAVAGVHQIGELGFNVYKAVKANDAKTKAKHKQNAFQNAVNIATIGIVTALIVGAMISPMGAAVILGLAITAIALTALQIGWKLLPNKPKETIKTACGFSEACFFTEKDDAVNDQSTKHSQAPIETTAPRLYT